jgi:hypothetical protein
MALLKNTFGVSIGFEPKMAKSNLLGKLGGSSLERKEKPMLVDLDPIEKLLSKPLKCDEVGIKLRSMSPRTKSKIRQKSIALARLYKRLSFVTLTFVNEVTDRQGIKVLGAFLDNVKREDIDFQYLWVAERQKNGNIHFHLITNKFWNIDRWWRCWLNVQANNAIIPRNENFKPGSAFDVKKIISNDIKGVGNYLTKYVTKNDGEFACQVWNCSRKISQLYTHFYTDMEFLRQLERLESVNQLGGKIQYFQQEHCNVHLIPLNNNTTKFYNRIDEKNRIVWNTNNLKIKKRVPYEFEQIQTKVA